MNDTTESQSLMADVIEWAGDSPERWDTLLGVVKSRYAPPVPFSLTTLSPRGVLFSWAGNRHSYSRGVSTGSSADISFFGRSVSQLEKSVPLALSLDPRMAEMFALKIKAGNKGVTNNVESNMELV